MTESESEQVQIPVALDAVNAGGTGVQPGEVRRDGLRKRGGEVCIGGGGQRINRMHTRQRLAQLDLLGLADRHLQRPRFGKDGTAERGPFGVAGLLITAEKADGPGDVFRPIVRVRRLAHRPAQGEVAGSESVGPALHLHRRAQMLVRLVVALHPGQRQAEAAQQHQRRRTVLHQLRVQVGRLRVVALAVQRLGKRELSLTQQDVEVGAEQGTGVGVSIGQTTDIGACFRERLDPGAGRVVLPHRQAARADGGAGAPARPDRDRCRPRPSTGPSAR